jgi:hypothetical protein
VLLLGLSAGIVLGQPIGPVPTPYIGPSANPMRIGNPEPPPPQDPWFVRYASVANMVGIFVIATIAFLAKAKVIDPLRAEFKAEALAVRSDLKDEAALRNLALVTTTAAFEKALGVLSGTVAGLNTGVAALGPAISSISTAAGEMARVAAAVGEKQAVAMTKLEALDDRVTRVEDTSVRLRKGRETPG